MPLDTLLATLTDEAEAEAEAERQRGRAEADAVAAAAVERVGRARATALDNLEREQRATVERELLVSRREARRVVLEARRDLVGAVFEAARQKFPETLETPAFLATLPSRIAETLAALGDRAATLRVHPRLAGDLAREVGQRATVVEDPTIGAGFRAVANDGSLEVDCTLETRLQALTPILSMEILKQTVEKA